MPHYFSTCGVMANRAAELTAVLANPAPVEASWCVPAIVQERLRGRWCSGWLTGRRGGPVRGCR
jgi:hypothetical protein